MLKFLLWMLAAVIGARAECILSEPTPATHPCSAKLVCDGTIEFLSVTVRQSFKCIKQINQQHYYYSYEPQYRYDENYDLSVQVNYVNTSISDSPLLGLLKVNDKIITLNIDGGNFVSFPEEVKTITRLKKLSLTHNNIESVNINDDFITLPNIQMINMSYNLLSTIERRVDTLEFSSLATIDLSHNLIESIPDKCFSWFSHLKYLDLSFNKLVSFDILTFEGMTQIETLLLSNNRLIEIGQNFARFEKLKQLSLDHNHLTTITNLNFKMLTNLENFNLSYNFIKNIEENSFYALRNLVELDLSHNNIRVINKSLFKNNIRMYKLFLSHNDIDEIESGAFAVNNISIFDINSNSLSIPIKEYTFQGIHEQNLDLSGGKIKSLGNRAFSAFGSDLMYLNLSFNHIENISQSAFQSLEGLSRLDLSYNQLTDIDFDVNDLKELSHYYLQHNNIKKIKPKMFENLTKLITLDISQNSIEEIELDSFIEVSNLVILNISNNYLSSSLPESLFKGLEKVEHLDMSYTRVISYQNETFAGMVSLILLNSSHGQLEKIEYEAYKETGALQIINLSYNMLECFHVNTSNILELSELYLDHNNIKNIIGETFKNLKRLGKLNLAFNNILYIDSISLQPLAQLYYLNLSSNVHLKFNSEIFNHLSLSKVSLTGVLENFSFDNAINTSISTVLINHCNIEDINSVFIYKISDIVRLGLSSNRIKFLDKTSFQRMSVLNWLDLSLNMISYIQPGTFRFTNMIDNLNLYSNNLQYLPFGALDGLKNLHHLNLSSNAIHTFGSNLLHSTPVLSSLSLENNNLANINFIEFSKTNVKLLYVGGNVISCDVLARLKKNDLGNLKVTAERLDFNTENVDGTSCRTSVLQKSADSGYNFTNAVYTSVQSAVEHLYGNLSITLNDIFSKIGSSLETNLSAHLDNISTTLTNNRVSTNEIVSSLLNESVKLQSSVINENNDLVTNMNLIITLLEINNNLTQIANNGTKELTRAIIQDTITKVDHPVSKEIAMSKSAGEVHNVELSLETTLVDMRMLFLKIVWILCCIAVGLGIIILILVVILIHKYLTRNETHKLRKTNVHSSGHSMRLDLEME